MNIKNAAILLIASATLYGAAPQERTGARVWIFFKDRPQLHAVAAEPAGFSAASIKRRQLRGEVVGWEASDYAVDPKYVQAIQAAGGIVNVESRWLNAVSAHCAAECQKRVGMLPYVSEIRPVITYSRAFEPIVADHSATPLITEARRLQYGASKDQLRQLHVPAVHGKGHAGEGEIVAVFDTGFRKDHIAFSRSEVVDERDFVFDDDNVSNGTSTDSHGTGTWSCVGGRAPGKLYGAAYKAKFLLAVTEDIRSETVVEEDNWVAALEWADRNGAGVISSSLGYTNWYRPSDFDGRTAITSRVASTAARKGIVVVNSVGNSGPGASTLGAPADAFKILAVGAVTSLGIIANFSSRGPTADGRTKPEVVARGISTYVASSQSRRSFGRSDGTSFSCPLVAGCAAVLLSARPDWKPVQVREALMETASQASNPDNTFGHGVVNLNAALDYLPKNAIVIDHKELKNTSNNAGPYRITARIRAQRGINRRKLFVVWKRSESATFQKVKLSAVAGKPDQFQASLPGQPAGSTIVYYLTAKDAKGKTGKLPVDAPQNLFDFRIR